MTEKRSPAEEGVPGDLLSHHARILSVEIGNAEALGRSTSLLLHHLAKCVICQQYGTRYCDDIENIIAVVRHDRLHLGREYSDSDDPREGWKSVFDTPTTTESS